MRGYKVFNPDWTCRGFQFEIGEIYEEDVTPSCCSRGFHFCTELKDCFSYYSFDPNNKVAEIEALGEIDAESDENKHCTNKIKIVREISWEEVLKMVNMGKANTGLCNSGHYNSGHYNSGNYNTGNWNSGNRNNGYFNSGHRNSGHYNSGDYNTGDYNSGDYNSGNYNSGNYNSGDWNKCNFSSGCFNTIEHQIYLFNKPSEWTYRDWMDSEAYTILSYMPNNALQYIAWENMTDEEKNTYPEAGTTCGYLKKLDNSECRIKWWRNLSNEQKAVITAIPNFDKEIFKEITGIDIDEEDTNE